MKYVSLVLLVVQTTSLVTSIRFSQTVVLEGHRYLSSAAVFWMEVIKMVAALLVILFQTRRDFFSTLRNEVASSLTEIVKLAVPSFLYVVQNNILYLAIANLDAPTYQVSCFSFEAVPFLSLSGHVQCQDYHNGCVFCSDAVQEALSRAVERSRHAHARRIHHTVKQRTKESCFLVLLFHLISHLPS